MVNFYGFFKLYYRLPIISLRSECCPQIVQHLGVTGFEFQSLNKQPFCIFVLHSFHENDSQIIIGSTVLLQRKRMPDIPDGLFVIAYPVICHA